MDPVHRRRLTRAAPACSTRTSPPRSPTTSARSRARWSPALEARHARRALRQRPAASSPSRRICSTRIARAPSAANLLVRRAAFEQVGGFYEGVRAAEDTDFSWRLQQAGWRLELRPGAHGRASLPDDARRAAPAVARLRGRPRVARAPLRRVRARARGAAGGPPGAWRALAARRGGCRGGSRAGAAPQRSAVERGTARARALPRARRAAVGRGAGRIRAVEPARSRTPPARGAPRSCSSPTGSLPAAIRWSSSRERSTARASRPPPGPTRPTSSVAGALQIDYLEDDGHRRAGAAALIARRCATRCAARATCSSRRPGEPPLSALAPAVRRLERDRARARARARRPEPRGRPRAGSPGWRRPSTGVAALMRVHVVDPSAYTPPYDHALCAALAPAPAPRSSWSRAGSRTARPRARRLRGARVVLPPCARRARLAAAARAPSCVEHVPDMLALPRRRPCGRRRPLPVARGPGARPLPAPAATDRADRPRPAAARAATGPGRCPAAAVRRRRRGHRPLASTGAPARRRARGRRGQGARDPPRRVRAPDASAGRAAAAASSARRAGARSCCSSACCARTRGSRCCSTPGAGIDGERELWIVGRPRMPIEPLRAPRAGERAVRAAVRLGRRAAGVLSPRRVVVLPYSRTERFDFSGVLATALAFGKPTVVSDVGRVRRGRGDRRGAAGPPGDPDALARRARRAARRIRRRARGSPGGRGRRGGTVLVAGGGRADAALYRELVGSAAVTVARDRLLAVGRPDRLLPTSATRCCSGCWRRSRGRGRGARRRDAPAPDDELPTVSVIVAAYAEQDVIAERVANLRALDYPPELIELIVACDGSPDATAAASARRPAPTSCSSCRAGARSAPRTPPSSAPPARSWRSRTRT